ncbi:MAG TPA: CpsD/CapB family tyrosine-protein kinase [Acidimicrobiia bacterium]|nr:CpsD/CapB family tyrosine-protein kinase [Acidimicrobiia bacterium]
MAAMSLLGLVGGATFGLVALPPVYASESRVLVRPITGDTSKPVQPVDALAMGTERELVYADQVAVLVQQRTGWKGSPAALRRPLRVSLRGGTQTMALTYRASEPGRARLGAQVFAESYLTYRSTLAAATKDGARRNLEAALRAVADRIAGLRQSLPPAGAGTQAAGDSLLQEAAPYQTRLAELNVVDTTASGTVVEPANLPTRPSGPGPWTAAGLGALLGLVAGGSIVSYRGTVDRRLRGRGDVETQLGAPVLASVPRTRRARHSPMALVTLAVPDGPAAEAYRGLRARILAMGDGWGLKTVMVAGPTAESGTTAIAANLAVSMAATGRQVALVAADLRSPEIHRYFGLRNDRGLSNVLSGELAPSEATQEPPGLETLRVLPAGPSVPDPAELLEAGPMQMVLDERCEVSDFVVVEAPPALSATEALTLAPMVDGIVVVADARHATREEMAEIGDQLRLVGGNVVGAVLCNLRS